MITDLIRELVHSTSTPSDQVAVLVFLREHRGAANAILRSDLAQLTGMTERAVRKAVKGLIEERGVPINSGQNGIYIIATERERQIAKSDLLSRARSLEHRAFALDGIKLVPNVQPSY